MQRGTRLLLAGFTLLTALATHQLLVLGRDTDRFWAWTIQSPPTATFLGAAYAAGFVLSVLALRQRSWQRVRVPVLTVTVFTVLTLVATLLHAHRLHFTAEHPEARAAAWFWLVVYLVVPGVCLVVVLRQERGRRRTVLVRRPLPRWLRVLLAGQGLVLAGSGGVLFAGGLAVHHGVAPMTAFWPWPLMPLGAQIVGAWLIAFGVATALVIRDADLDRLRVPAVAYTAFGAFQIGVLLVQGPHLDGGVSVWVSAVVLASIVGAGGYGWWMVRGEVPASPVPRPRRPA